MDNTNTNDKAKRSEKKPSYRLIYKGFLEAIAHTLQEGHTKYSEGEFDRNWQKGDQEFFREALDHALEHLMTYNETGDRYHNGEDHIAHAAANLMMLTWAEDFKKINWPHLEEEQYGDIESTDFDLPQTDHGLPFKPTFDHFDPTIAEELEREAIILKEIEEKEKQLNWFDKFLKKT